jgi:hypothetical protein
LGNPFIAVSYVDASLYHDLIIGRPITSIISFCNHSFVEWCSKRQAFEQTATFVDEVVTARNAVGQNIVLRATPRYLGIIIQERSFKLREIQAVVFNYGFFFVLASDTTLYPTT